MWRLRLRWRLAAAFGIGSLLLPQALVEPPRTGVPAQERLRPAPAAGSAWRSWQHVRRQGGAVWVEDRPGGGARFVLELPELER